MKAICPICKNKLKEHSELQDKICNMITVKQFANNCPGKNDNNDNNTMVYIGYKNSLLLFE